MITCCNRYELAPGKYKDFEHYTRGWAAIIRELGGVYHGCFMPGEQPSDAASFSHPAGIAGPRDIAVVLYSFPDMEGYESYRKHASAHPNCASLTRLYQETQCFTRYERTFLTPLEL